MPSSSDRRRNGGRWWRGALALAATLAAAVAALYVAFPWLLAAAAPRLAGPLGLDSLHVVAQRPGVEATAVPELAFSAGRLRVTARGVTVRYRPGDLLRGRVAAVAAEAVAVSVDPPLASVEQDPGAFAVRAPVPEPGRVLAGLPLDRLQVELLEVSVPALGFFARGTLRLQDGALTGRLRGLAPAAAERLVLDARLGPQGDAELALTAPGRPAAPFLELRATVAGPRLALRGRLDLQGFPFDLAAALAGLPAGEGELRGELAGESPWPPTRDGWGEAAGEGTFEGHWQPAGADLALSAGTVTWAWSGGRLRGRGDGTVQLADVRVPWYVTADELDPAGARGAGSLMLGEAAPAPLLDVRWMLEPEALTLDGGYRLDERALGLLPEDQRATAGSGLLEGRLTGRLTGVAEGVPRPRLAGTVEGGWKTPPAALRRVAGDWQLEGDAIAADLRGELEGLNQTLPLQVVLTAAPRDGRWHARATLLLGGGVRLPLELRHDPATGLGRLDTAAEVDVDAPLLAALLADWQPPMDVTGGMLGLEGGLAWGGRDDGGLTGSARLELSGVDGRLGELVLTGLDADLGLAGTAAAGWSLSPTHVTLRRLDTGVTIHDLAAGIAWSGDVVAVESVEARLLGGTVRAAPFTYRVDAGAADPVVELAGVDLARVLALEGGHVSGTGTIGGRLPLSVRDHRPRIEGGKLASEPPGGVIRVSPSLVGGSGQPGLDFALRALADFRYDVLTAGVDYSADGDLALAVRLEGHNPEIEGGRPIHYNVNVNENVPTLLRSLRLQDEVTREVERQVRD